MKFKIIFILFNILIVFSFFMLMILPATVFGSEYASEFWRSKWYFSLFFAAVIGGLNIYFARNWKMFTYLENENWNGLTAYLEGQIYTKKKITKRKVLLLINTYILHSQIEDLQKLSVYLETEKFDVKRNFILQFGIVHLVRNDPEAISEYFGRYMHLKTAQHEWINWCYSFGLVMQRNIDDGRKSLLANVSDIKSPIVLLLTLYLLDSIVFDDAPDREFVTQEKEAFSRKYTSRILTQELEKAKSNVLIVVLLKIINQAIDWLFPPAEADGEKIS